jgi:CrcB protein
VINNIVLVFVGSGLGGVLRYTISKFLTTNSGFPIGILLANLIASFTIGLLLVIGSQRFPSSERLYVLLAIGFCGGLSTFSSFAADNVQFLKSKELLLFFLNSSITFVGCLLAVWIGINLGRHILNNFS